MSRPSHFSSHQHGVVLSEYVIGTALVCLALFAPLPGPGVSVFVYVLQALGGFQANTSYLMSLP